MSILRDPVQEVIDWLTNPSGSQRLTFKHAIINEKEADELKQQESQHVLSLQKSRYLVIDGIQEELNVLDYRSIEDKSINLRFAHVDDVNRKR